MMRNICIYVSLLIVLFSVRGQKTGLRNLDLIQNDVQRNWKDAQTECRSKYTDLVTVRNDKDNLTTFIGWIGLHRDTVKSPWKWSRGEENATYFNWADGQPKDQFPSCSYSISGKWSNDDCGRNRRFICFDEKLVLVKENKTWEEALDHCRSLSGKNPQYPISETNKPKYDLATLITGDDHDYARERAQEATTDEVWTGLRFLGYSWLWVGGEEVQYPDLPSCPVLRCGVMEKNNNTTFGLKNCSEKKNFFCYKTP